MFFRQHTIKGQKRKKNKGDEIIRRQLYMVDVINVMPSASSVDITFDMLVITIC